MNLYTDEQKEDLKKIAEFVSRAQKYQGNMHIGLMNEAFLIAKAFNEPKVFDSNS